MKFRQARLAVPLVMLLPVLSACNGDDKPAASTGATASPTTASATPTRTYTKQELKKALLPPEQVPGYAEVSGEAQPDGIANTDVSEFMPLKGIPRKCRATGGGPGLVDTSGVTPQIRKAPTAGVLYGEKTNFIGEELIGLPSGTPPGIGKLRIPPGCERQEGKMRGMPVYAEVRQLAAADLPALGNVEITGLQVDFHETTVDALMMSYRVIQVRSGHLMMQFVSSTGEGDIAKVTNAPVTKAWTYAKQRLG